MAFNSVISKTRTVSQSTLLALLLFVGGKHCVASNNAESDNSPAYQEIDGESYRVVNDSWFVRDDEVLQRLEDSAPGNFVPGTIPFSAIQYGTPRSGSTFQTALVCTLLRIRRPDTVCAMGPGGLGFRKWQEVRKYRFMNKPLLLKTHHLDIDNIANKSPHLPVFASVDTTDHITKIRTVGAPYKFPLLTQHYVTFSVAPLAEIERYKPIFKLTDLMVLHLREYFTYWSVLRTCCSDQASIELRLQLHNCTKNRRPSWDPSHPHCNMYNLETIENLFEKTEYYKIGYGVGSDTNAKHKVGDCKKVHDKIKGGADMNFGVHAGNLHIRGGFKCPE